MNYDPPISPVPVCMYYYQEPELLAAATYLQEDSAYLAARAADKRDNAARGWDLEMSRRIQENARRSAELARWCLMRLDGPLLEPIKND